MIHDDAVVYRIRDGATLEALYVGCTCNIKRRIGEHCRRAYAGLHVIFDWSPALRNGVAQHFEALAIEALQPRDNVQLRGDRTAPKSPPEWFPQQALAIEAAQNRMLAGWLGEVAA